MKSTESPLSLREDDGCNPLAPTLPPPPMPRHFFDTPSTCAHGHPTATATAEKVSVRTAVLPEKEKPSWQSRRAHRARATDKGVTHVPHRSAGARAGPAAAGAARGRRRRGGGGTSRRPWTRWWRGRGGAPGRRRARRRTPLVLRLRLRLATRGFDLGVCFPPLAVGLEERRAPYPLTSVDFSVGEEGASRAGHARRGFGCRRSRASTSLASS